MLGDGGKRLSHLSLQTHDSSLKAAINFSKQSRATK